MKIAGAPISWGVCEVPGWGYQLDPDRVLSEMRDVGLSATELGPEGFLPTEPDELTALLDRHGLSCVGSVRRRWCCTTPTTIRCPTSPGRWNALVAAGRQVSGAGRGDRHRRVRLAARHSTTVNGRRCWPTWTGSPTPPPSAGSPRCCTRTSARWSRRATRWTGCWTGSIITLCLDTGHLLIGGTDPLQLARAGAGPNRARPSQGCRRRAGRPRAVRRAHLHRGGRARACTPRWAPATSTSPAS